MWISNSSTVYWKDCSFSIELSWHPCQKSVDCKYEDLVLDSLFCSPKCLSLCWSHSDLFTIDFEIGKYESSNFFKASLIAQLVKNPLAVQETRVGFLGREDLLEKGWATHSSVPGPQGKSPTVRKTWVQSLGWEDPLEKGKATHSSILAWRTPWTV